MPSLRGRWSTSTSRSRAARRSAIWPVPSGEPSSTTSTRCSRRWRRAGAARPARSPRCSRPRCRSAGRARRRTWARTLTRGTSSQNAEIADGLRGAGHPVRARRRGRLPRAGLPQRREGHPRLRRVRGGDGRAGRAPRSWRASARRSPRRSTRWSAEGDIPAADKLKAQDPRRAWCRSPASRVWAPSARALLHEELGVETHRRPAQGGRGGPAQGRARVRRQGRGERARRARGRRRRHGRRRARCCPRRWPSARSWSRGCASTRRRSGWSWPAAPGAWPTRARTSTSWPRRATPGAGRGLRRAARDRRGDHLRGGGRQGGHPPGPARGPAHRARGQLRQPAPALHRLGPPQRGAAHGGGEEGAARERVRRGRGRDLARPTRARPRRRSTSCWAWPTIEPELREDRGELEAARDGELPELMRLEDIRGDLHCHTTASDGRNTIAEMAAGARRSAATSTSPITDHSATPRLRQRRDRPTSCGARSSAWRQVDEKLEDFRVLAGTETNVLPDGVPGLRRRAARAARLGRGQRAHLLPHVRGRDDRADGDRDRAPAGGRDRPPHRPADRPARALRAGRGPR